MVAQASVKEVTQRADVVEIVGQFVRLKKRGSNYIGNCPFHNEKTPSFNVSAGKGIYKCFGCGRGGDVISFVMEHEKLPYIDAIRWLADYYKIQLEETEQSAEQIQHHQAEDSLRILNEFAATWFHQSLKDTEEGQAIGLSYFKQRGLRGETIDKFRLGYCPEEGDAFYSAAVKRGYQQGFLDKSGLAKERNGSWYDVYRGRVTFPIQSNTGKVLGFGARILKSNDRAPKYINTPENEIYIKSKVLYGMYQARQAIGKKDECFLVEGYLDVISLHQAGIENVVASSGTSLTEDQLRAIGQLTKNLTILYDSDPAGVKAALRGLDMALGQSFNVKLALLPAGEDPDSLVQRMGTTAFLEYLEGHKRDVIGFRMEVGMKEVGEDPVKKSKLVNEIAETISRINKAEDFALQQHYLREASRQLEVDETGMTTLVNKYIRDHVDADRRLKDRQGPRQAEAQLPETATDLEGLPEARPAVNPQEAQEWQLIRVLLEHGDKLYEGYRDVAAYIQATVEPDFIETQLARHFYDAYFSSNPARPELSFFTAHRDDAFRRQAATLLQSSTDISHNWKDMYGIETFAASELSYVYDVNSTVAYFEWKKNKLLLEEVSQRLQHETSEARLRQLMMSFQELKKNERDIVARHGTVILKLQSAGK